MLFTFVYFVKLAYTKNMIMMVFLCLKHKKGFDRNYFIFFHLYQMQTSTFFYNDPYNTFSHWLMFAVKFTIDML